MNVQDNNQNKKRGEITTIDVKENKLVVKQQQKDYGPSEADL